MLKYTDIAADDYFIAFLLHVHIIVYDVYIKQLKHINKICVCVLVIIVLCYTTLLMHYRQLNSNTQNVDI